MDSTNLVNLDLLPLGWVHSAACLVAIAAGVLILLRPKGTPIHRLRGRVYVLAIVVTSLTAFGIYRRGIFFFPHWFAVAALVTIAVGFMAARFKIPRTGWMHLHLTCMVASFYILIGGGVNEVFLRVLPLRRLVPDFNSPVVGLTHLAVIVFFAALIAYFNVSTLIRSRASRRALSGSGLPSLS